MGKTKKLWEPKKEWLKKHLAVEVILREVEKSVILPRKEKGPDHVVHLTQKVLFQF